MGDWKSRIKRGLRLSPSTTMNSAEEKTDAGIIPVLVNSTEFPKMQEAKKKIPYGEPIGHRAPRRAKRNVSVGREKEATKVETAKEENWDEDWPMDTGVTEAEVPVATKDNKKRQKQKRKKRKPGAMVVDPEEEPLSNEGTHFRTFVRKHFSIILRRMGKDPGRFQFYSFINFLFFLVRNFTSEKLQVVKSIVTESEILKLVLQDHINQNLSESD